MNVPDSSAWIEHFSAGPLASIFLPIIEDRKKLIVPTIVLFEVHKWLLVYRSENDAQTAASTMMKNKIVQLTPSLAFDASRLSVKHKLAMADAIIYASAIANAAEVWTTDGHFKGLPNVRFFEKN
ncbi:MAG TPA: type II toxin-antitoxin system VapC family toxin [Candidatus Kapabacteria bacterium]|nr:type II toxin-antitoxin system VapC family toxin [Candidatus Kapabacteria bacterium]